MVHSNTEQYYDLIYKEWIDDDKTTSELTMIQSLVDEKAAILDVGCGTGRHLIPLRNAGYLVMGLDRSKNMLSILEKKVNSKDNLLIGDIYLNVLDEMKFDLIICMWNAIAEMAHTKSELVNFYKRSKQLLGENGKLLFDLSISEYINPEEDLRFDIEKKKGNRNYRLEWRPLKFDPNTRITICEEKIVVTDEKSNTIDTAIMQIHQRWWSDFELINIAKAVGLKVKKTHLPNSEQTYFILSSQ